MELHAMKVKGVKKRVPYPIFIVSDATGQTASRILRSTLVQFGQVPVDVVQRSAIRSKRLINSVVNEAAQRGALIVHTLASSRLRRHMLQQSRVCNVESMDMMGPIIDRLSAFLKVPPKEEAGLTAYFLEGKPREIEAVAFAFHHDDGQGLDDIDKAEMIVVGVSRAMKTPTMLYLAYHGWYVANVPLIMEIPTAPELLRIPPQKIFCLVPTEMQLLEVRRTRATVYGFPPSKYTDPDYIRSELAFARKLCAEHRWRTIETSGKSIEEIAHEIVELHMPGRALRREALV